MAIRESLLNTITSVASSDFVRLVTSAGESSKATVANLFKSFESGLSAKSSLTTSDYIRVVGSDNASYKQLVSDVAKKIIEDYTGSSLAGSSQSVKSAIDKVNSKIYSYKTGVSYDTLVSTGFYYCEAMTDRPSTTYSVYGLIVIATSGSSVVKQIAYPMVGEANWYMRHYISSGWSAWKTMTT